MVENGLVRYALLLLPRLLTFSLFSVYILSADFLFLLEKYGVCRNSRQETEREKKRKREKSFLGHATILLYQSWLSPSEPTMKIYNAQREKMKLHVVFFSST